MRLWRFALPLWDVPAVTGDAAPAADPLPSDDEGGSLADHEAAHGVTARVEADPEAQPVADTRDRDDKTGQFKPRHRAASQRATAEDVPRIQELTRRLRDAEARLEAAERRSAPREEPATREPAAKPDRFPRFETWLLQHPEQDFDDWLDARDEHRDQRRAATEAQTADQRRVSDAERTFTSKLDAARERYPDYDDVVVPGTPVSLVIQRAVLEVGPDAAYWLATHPKERDELTDDSLVAPSEAGFGAAVATMRRYLSSLVASEQRVPSRAAAGSTGAALTPVLKPSPKPPTPVRTGPLRRDDAPPSDDDGLAAHERAYGPNRKRA